ncbi:hypothetical protein [Streptosporangium sp. NBC_01756]|uniref:hypothetical protein n=1 Tax=Streptosporangium sp. NBC_01756 TaxID=2975950 RepID=UPI002DD95B3C|nr:hypothetical protein [Streptosporangium sp. NBC_01756]WSC88863.1 hypothetical protein OIE48_11970 [Streptosporangium sp. NBC_01756]
MGQKSDMVGFTEGKVKGLGDSIGGYAPDVREKANKTRNNGLHFPKCGVIGIGLDLAHENTCAGSADALDAAASVLESWKTALAQVERNNKAADDKSTIPDKTRQEKTEPGGKKPGSDKPGANKGEKTGTDFDPGDILSGSMPGSGPGAGSPFGSDLGDMPSGSMPGSGLGAGSLSGSGIRDMSSNPHLGALPGSSQGNVKMPDSNYTVPNMPDTKDDLANSLNPNSLNPNIPNTPDLGANGAATKLPSPDLGDLAAKDPRLTDLAGVDPNNPAASQMPQMPETPQVKIPDAGTSPGESTGAGATTRGTTIPSGSGSGGSASPLAGPRVAGMNGSSMMPPMMPPMGGAPGGNQGGDRDKSSVLTGDESDWDDDIDATVPVIGQEA